jgi:hypothetical protein
MWTGIYLAALAIFLLAVLGGSAFLTVRVLRFFRTLKAVRRAIFDGLERVADAADHAAERAAELTADDALPQALARLRRTTTQLAVLRAAVEEVQDSIAAVTVWYPRK